MNKRNLKKVLHDQGKKIAIYCIILASIAFILYLMLGVNIGTAMGISIPGGIGSFVCIFLWEVYSESKK